MNPYVIAWVWISAVGLILSIYLTRESVLDLRHTAAEWAAERRAAWSRLAREFLRVTVHAVYLVIGLPALYTPSSGFDIIVVGLLWGNVVLLCNSLIDAVTRSLNYSGFSGQGEGTAPGKRTPDG